MHPPRILLGVNIDHIATLPEPDQGNECHGPDAAWQYGRC